MPAVPAVRCAGLKGFDKMIPMPLEEDLIMCMACCCVKYSIYKKCAPFLPAHTCRTSLKLTSRKMRRVPECIGCSAKNECLCYKYALQERCSFNPTLFFEDCKCAMCDFREGNDIVRRTTFLASLQNSPADLTAGRGGAERPGLRLHLRRVRLPLLRRVPRRDRLL